MKNDVQNLNIIDNVKSILKDNQIKTIEQLCQKTKRELKKIGLLSNEIDQINIQLQLQGKKLKNSL